MHLGFHTDADLLVVDHRQEHLDIERIEPGERNDIAFLVDELAGRELLLGNDAVDRAADGALLEGGLGAVELKLRQLLVLLLADQILLGNFRLGAHFLSFTPSA